MSFKMNVSITQDAESLVSKIRNWIEQEGGTFSGDTNSGCIVIKTFMGTVKGHYVVNGNDCELEITEKPFLVSNGIIESTIKDALEKT